MLRIPSITVSSAAVFVGALIIGAYVVFGGPNDVKKKKRKKYNIPGLANIGNSCFLNALVQALASCPLFVSWLRSKYKEPSPPLVSALHNLLKVLNNDSENSGDACAGEVLCALRGHGWVISSEEQDAHEFFHALTATIDDELAGAVSMPSLLDVSWMDTGINTLLPVNNAGVVLRSDCWRQSDDDDLSQLKSIKYFGVNQDGNLKIKNIENVNDSCNSFSSLNGENNGDINDESSKLDGENNGDIINDESSKVDGENFGMINGVPKLNGDINPSNENMKKPDCDSERCGIVSSHADNASLSKKGEKETEDSEEVITSEICNNTNKIINNNLSEGAISCNANSIESSYSSENITEGKCSDMNDSAKVNINGRENVSYVNGSNHTDSVNDITIVKTGIDSKEAHVVPWKNLNDNQDSPFRGNLVSQLQCTLCGYRNPAQWTTFESLSLSLPSIPWGEVTIQSLLDSYITQERVTDVTCDGCTKKAGANVKTAFTKQLTIGKLPSCLCFHIKRTVWMDNGSAVKRQDHVLFPEFLTMDPYTYMTSVNNQEFQSRLLGGKEANLPLENTCPIPPSSLVSSSATSTENEANPLFHVARLRCEHLYRLKAVIVHVGDAFCGHFVTYRRGALGTRARNKWFYTSDLSVRETHLDDVRKANAYMILYEKVTE